MRGTAAASTGVVQRIRFRFRQRDQILGAFHRQRRMHHQRIRRHAHQCHLREITHRVIRQLRVQRLINRNRVVYHHQRVTIGRRFRHQIGANRATRTGTIFHDHALLERFGQALRDKARGDVVAAPRRKRHDDADGFGGIRLRANRTRTTRHKRCGKRQIQRPLHGVLSQEKTVAHATIGIGYSFPSLSLHTRR